MKGKNWELVKDELRDLYYSGISMKEIGKRFGVSDHQICVVVKRFGWKNRYLVSVEEEKNRLSELINSGLTLTEIAEKDGVSISAISYKVRKYGIDHTSMPQYKEILENRIDEVENLLKQGFNAVEISKILNVNIDPLRNAIRHFNIDKKAIKQEISNEVANKIKALVEAGLNTNQISKEIGISISTVQTYYEKYSISPVEYISNHYTKEELESYLRKGLMFKEISQKYYNSVDSSAILHAAKRFDLLHLYQPKSNGSFGESCVESVLRNLGFTYESQVKYEIEGRNSNTVIVDFIVYFKDKTYAIEYNGLQHYQFVEHFHKTFENFEKQKIRDENVKKYFGKFFIEIPYTLETIESISEFLNKVLFEGIDPTTLIDYDELYK